MKTIKFYTLGCKANQYDTQSIRERFLEHGFREIGNGRRADICVINTCTVTACADQKSKGIIRHCIKANPKARVVVTGCLVQKDAVSLSRIKGIDLIVSKSFFPERISNFFAHTRAFLKIQDGCDNFCSYCKVPLVRGASRSRPLNQIIREAEDLAKNGFQEIVLSGICLGAYGKDLLPKIDLVTAIEAMERIDGLLRIRLSSIEVRDISEELINKIAESRKLCRHLHIPLQSGADEILKKMRRNYCRNDYLYLIRKIKMRIPGIAITTDCLVGFPGENEDYFQNTLDLLKEILPLKVHIFPYSKREGTLAKRDFKDTANPAIIKERLLRLKAIASVCALSYKKQFLHKKAKVLIEGRAKDDPVFWEGYTDNYLKVRIKTRQNLKNFLSPLNLPNQRTL